MGTSTSKYEAINHLFSGAYKITYHIIYIAIFYTLPLLPSLPLTRIYKYISTSLSLFLSEYESQSTSIDP